LSFFISSRDLSKIDHILVHDDVADVLDVLKELVDLFLGELLVGVVAAAIINESRHAHHGITRVVTNLLDDFEEDVLPGLGLFDLFLSLGSLALIGHLDISLARALAGFGLLTRHLGIFVITWVLNFAGGRDDLTGEFDVLGKNLLAALKLGVGGGETNHGLQHTSGDDEVALLVLGGLGHLSHANVVVGQGLDCVLGQDGLVALLDVLQILLEEIQCQIFMNFIIVLRVELRSVLLVDLTGLCVFEVSFGLNDCGMDLLGAASAVVLLVLGAIANTLQHLTSDLAIHLGGGGITDDKDEIETRQQGIGKIDVLGQGFLIVPIAFDRVRCRDDRAAGVETGVDTGLGNGHCLLFHNLMDCGAIVGSHLVELIDADDTAISENHGARLESALFREGIGSHCRGETNTTGTATSSGNGVGRDAHAETEKLGLTTRGITNHENVGITTKAGAVRELLGNAAGKHKDETLLDPLMSPDVGGERAAEEVEGIRLVGNFLEFLDVLTGPFTLLNGVVDLTDVVANDTDGEHATGDGVVGLGHGAVDTVDFDTITGLDLVAQILLDDDVAMAGHLAGGGLLGELLQDELLGIAILAEADVSFDRVAILILGRHLTGGGLLREKGGGITVLTRVNLSGFGTVVDRDCELRDAFAHLSDNTADADGLVHEVGVETTNGNVMATMSTGKTYLDETLGYSLVVLGVEMRYALVQGFFGTRDEVSGVVDEVVDGLGAPLLDVGEIEDETLLSVGHHLLKTLHMNSVVAILLALEELREMGDTFVPFRSGGLESALGHRRRSHDCKIKLLRIYMCVYVSVWFYFCFLENKIQY